MPLEPRAHYCFVTKRFALLGLEGVIDDQTNIRVLQAR